MNLFVSTSLLRPYAKRSEWEAASPELCRRVLGQIIAAGPSAENWQALLELLAVWPVATDVQAWVREIEGEVSGWPWRLRECLLGHRATLAGKACVFRLVGMLTIDKVEDLYGQQVARWAQHEAWQNLRGLSLVNVETEADHLAVLTAGRYLQGLVHLELKNLDSLSGGIPVMFGAEQLPDLRELALVSVGLLGADIEALGKAALARHISSLNLSGNYLNSTDLGLLLDPAVFPELQTLNLSQMTITADPLLAAIGRAAHPKLARVIIAGTPAAKSLGVEVITPAV